MSDGAAGRCERLPTHVADHGSPSRNPRYGTRFSGRTTSQAPVCRRERWRLDRCSPGVLSQALGSLLQAMRPEAREMICGNGRSAYSDARRLTVEAAGERSSTETLLWDVPGSEPNGG